MKLLIGNTGLIGTTLKSSITFDFEFNSKNIDDLLELNIDQPCDLYLACLPATKWMVNKNPQEDLNNIFRILEIISKKQYNRIILYSTIDVYEHAPIGSNESYPLQVSTPSYGSNRLFFERIIQTTISYNSLLILRLPALFGKYIKKNIVYDLLNNNNINKINYNSIYQWYNLNDLVHDTIHCLDLYQTKISTINLFTEPIHTSEILKLFNIDKSDVDTKSTAVEYNFKTNSNSYGYIRDRERILHELKEFISSYSIRTTKVAVCLFGEPRDIVSRISDWQKFSRNFDTHFYLAFYSNDHINETLDLLKKQLPVKSFYVTDNDLNYFDKLKYKSPCPINIHTADYKATFSRITSQCYIRQKATSLVEMNDYDVILLCRSDVTNFNISYSDILNIIKTNDLLIVNSGTHVHAGGGGGCTKCTIDSKCNLQFHANDICDWWCMGSPNVMKKWNTFYDTVLETYYDIQKTVPEPKLNNELQCIPKPETNETMVVLPTGNWFKIENDVHCFYPEKLMRVTFKDTKILSATADKQIWQ
jgi:nucleoside-diphosphate-sugar epimerase